VNHQCYVSWQSLDFVKGFSVKMNNSNYLPKVAKSHKNEWLSINQFVSFMEDGKFIVRDEGKKDYGVDLNIELIINEEYASNYRFHAQLKCVEDSEKLKLEDLTYSYQLSTSNLRYLLNSPNSILILYFVDTNQFVWEWVEKVKCTIEERGINIFNTDKNQVNYRFSKVLNSKSKLHIYNEIISKSENIKSYATDKVGLRDSNNRLSDLNISLNTENTKRALKFYLLKIEKLGKMKELKLITQYSYEELLNALKSGVITSRLANALVNILHADLLLLTGTRGLSPVEYNQLINMLGEKNEE
jgi:hypothetical protein